MACALLTTDLEICKGKTFLYPTQWGSEPWVYKPITAITQTAPVQITATAHNLVNGWMTAVVSVKGMTEINAKNAPPKSKDFSTVTVVDANTIQLNKVNAADYTAYTSGGYLQYMTPVDLAGYTARMKIKTEAGGTELFSLTTENGRITLDNTLKTITLSIPATDTAALTFSEGVYDLELVSAGGIVTAYMAGKVTVEDEITT